MQLEPVYQCLRKRRLAVVSTTMALFPITPAWIRFSDFASERIEEELFPSAALTSTLPPPSTRH